MMTCRGNRAHRNEAGVTLVEMLVVVVIIGLMVGISVPAFQAGLPSIRLRGASTSVSQFLYAARNASERGDEAVLVEVDPAAGMLRYRSASGGAQGETELPQGVEIAAIAPRMVDAALGRRSFLIYPGGAAPAIAVELRNERGAGKLIRLDPITVSPAVEDLPTRNAP